MLAYSFCERDELGQVVFELSPSSYARVFDATYVKILLSSIKYAAITTVICLVAGYPVAYFIGRAREGVRNTAAHAGDGAVLDELPHPDVCVDDRSSSRRGS